MTEGSKQTYSECKRLLNRRDPLDRLIFECVKTGELDIGFVPSQKPHSYPDTYTRKSLPHRGKHSA